MLKMMLLQPNLATNARIAFNLCTLLITITTDHASKTYMNIHIRYIYDTYIIYGRYMNIFYQIFNSD